MDGLSRNPRSVAWSAAARRRQRPSRTFRPSRGVERFEERTLLSVALVSVNAAGTGGGDGSSLLGVGAPAASPAPGQATPALSADGKLMVFQSDATDLVTGVNDTNTAT